MESTWHVRWRPGWEVMCSDGQTREQCMWRRCLLLSTTDKHARTAAPHRSTLGPRTSRVQSRSAGGCAERNQTARTGRCSSISVSPPPSSFGVVRRDCGQSLPASLPPTIVPALLCAACCTNTRRAHSRHPNTLLASNDTSLHPHSTLINHCLLRFCH